MWKLSSRFRGKIQFRETQSKISSLLMILGDTERDAWHKMDPGASNFLN